MNGVPVMLRPSTKFLIVAFFLMTLEGCVGLRTFHEYARAGDTVALAAGRMKDFTRDNITVTITPSSGSPIVYAPNDPAVRAVVNLYPDPVSSMLVSMETGIDFTPNAQYYGNFVLANTEGEKDWWETTVFIDLPTTLPLGQTEIEITNPAGEYANSYLDIVSGVGTPNTFTTKWQSLNPDHLHSMERVAHFTVNFDVPRGSTNIPFAIQMELSHDPDVDHGGSGRAYVINPRGDLKNVTWSDTGSSLRVIIAPDRAQALSNIHDYKFYVAGGITNLAVQSIKAVDINGNDVSGVTATIESH